MLCPIGVLRNVPCKNFYIQSPALKEIDGFFVYFDSNGYTQGDIELRVMVVKGTKSACLPLHLVHGEKGKDIVTINKVK